MEEEAQTREEKAKLRVMQSQTKGSLEPPKSGKGKEWNLPWSLRRGPGPAALDPLISDSGPSAALSPWVHGALAQHLLGTPAPTGAR